MSVVKSNAHQVGQSATAANNFTLYQPATPDGTVRLGNGNSGSVTDLVTLTSAGNLGIGTSSPSFPNGSGLAVYNATVPRIKLANSTTGDAATDGTQLLVSGSDFYIQQREAASVIVATNGSDRVTIDSSGNLGLGVTPSASWQSTRRVLQIGGSGAVWASTSGAGSLFLSNNTYYDGTNFRYINTSGASFIGQSTDGSYSFNQAPSGTAGNAISFTQAMTLDASGNLLVGTTSQYGSAKVSVNGYVASSATGGGVFYTNSTTNEEVVFASAKSILGGAYVATDACIYTGKSTSKIYAMAYTLGVYLNTSGTSWTSNSDERLKTDLKPIENAAQKVSTLRAVTGRFKTDDESVSRSFLIAQDVQAVLPEAVDASDPDKLGVQYTDTIPLLVAAIKELSAELNLLKQKVNA